MVESFGAKTHESHHAQPHTAMDPFLKPQPLLTLPLLGPRILSEVPGRKCVSRCRCVGMHVRREDIDKQSKHRDQKEVYKKQLQTNCLLPVHPIYQLGLRVRRGPWPALYSELTWFPDQAPGIGHHAPGVPGLRHSGNNNVPCP